MIPSGYKTSKVYSVKPTDGSGDLTFSRSNDTATRVGPDGLIEKVRTNVVTYSQDFNDASWTKTAITISTSATANPVNGALTAQDAIPTAVSSSHRIFKLAGVVSAANTWSIYAKANGYNFITIVENGNTTANVSFNLSTGAVSSENSAVGQIQSLGNGWYRCSMIHTTATTPRFDVYVSPTDSLASYTGDGTSGVTLFGAQAQASDFGATDYIATTSAAVSVGPVANVPRLDYLNSSCPKLLLEPQRQNVITFSEQMDNAAWTKTNTTITANATTAPDGYLGACKSVPAVGQLGVLQQNHNITAGQANTISIFAKAGEWNLITLNSRDNASASNVAEISFNLSTGVVSTAASSTGAYSAASGTITNYGNGWYRLTLTHTSSISTTTRIRFIPSELGDGTKGLFVWGAQFETNASYASSYVNTLGAAVTRGADAMNLAALNNADMTFTAFLELDEPSIGSTALDWFNIRNAATLGRAFGYGNVFGFADAYSTSALSKTKMLWKQESGTTAKIFGDGALLGTSTTGTYSTPFTILEFYGAYLLKPVRIKQFIFFANNITDAQCIELTTL